VLVHPVIETPGPVSSDVLNLILVATERPAPSEGFLVQRWRQTRARVPSAPDLITPIRNRLEQTVRIDDVPTLTDDYAPTDALLLD
jgi:hypothetical protein